MTKKSSTRKRKRRARYYRIPRQPGNYEITAAAEPLHSPIKATVTCYGQTGMEVLSVTEADMLPQYASKWDVVWIDVDGLGNTHLIESIGHTFGLHKLVLEDIYDTAQQSKMEEYEKYVFLILKNGLLGDIIETEQISIILLDKIVISFQERPGDSFDRVRDQIKNGSGRIRQYRADFLAYALIASVVESYYPILDNAKKRMEAIEDTFLESKASNVIRQIHEVKNDLLFLHSAIWPIHDITIALLRDGTPCITAATTHYLRDCQDQAKQVKELSEFYRLICSDLMSTYLAYNDNKANEIMKVLTMVSTIFIPLSFIASLYGMNFDTSASPYNMPELKNRYGYPIVLSIMLGISTMIIWMFKLRGWIGHRKPSREN